MNALNTPCTCRARSVYSSQSQFSRYLARVLHLFIPTWRCIEDLPCRFSASSYEISYKQRGDFLSAAALNQHSALMCMQLTFTHSSRLAFQQKREAARAGMQKRGSAQFLMSTLKFCGLGDLCLDRKFRRRCQVQTFLPLSRPAEILVARCARQHG